jgi:hypothetical protein
MTPNPASQGNANTQTVDAAVAQAVRASCDAFKLSIQQCRNTTELICRGQYGLRQIPRDVSDFLCRFLCLTSELSTSCFDLIAACSSSDPSTQSTQPPVQGTASGLPAPVIQLSGRKLAEVTLSPLTPTSSAVVPTVVGLLSPDTSLPAINTVRFSAAPDRSRLVVHIRIADSQPAGSYTGSVIDSDTHQAIGTLTVRILQ